jgi:hypothetical protein
MLQKNPLIKERGWSPPFGIKAKSLTLSSASPGFFLGQSTPPHSCVFLLIVGDRTDHVQNVHNGESDRL